MQTPLGIFRLSALFVLAGALATAGPVGTLYITDTQGKLYHVQGNTSTSTPLNSPWESAFVVSSSTIRTIGVFTFTGTSQGYDYALDGTSIGPGANNTYGSQWLDAASDGAHIYAVQWPNSNVATPKLYQFNMDWTSPTFLWDVPVADTIGVTYDSSDQTLWMSSRSQHSVQHYKMDGTTLGGFAVPSTPLALALDPADGTLWMNFGSPSISQFSRSGQFLGTTAVPDLGYALGMEFAPTQSQSGVPEPATMLMSAAGLGATLIVRRRR